MVALTGSTLERSLPLRWPVRAAPAASSGTTWSRKPLRQVPLRYTSPLWPTKFAATAREAVRSKPLSLHYNRQGPYEYQRYFLRTSTYWRDKKAVREADFSL